MNEILLFNPKGLLIALVNYFIIRSVYRFVKRQLNNRGIYKDDVHRWLSKFFPKHAAIMLHFKEGHGSESVVDCSQDKCVVFQTN